MFQFLILILCVQGLWGLAERQMRTKGDRSQSSVAEGTSRTSTRKNTSSESEQRSTDTSEEQVQTHRSAEVNTAVHLTDKETAVSEPQGLQSI